MTEKTKVTNKTFKIPHTYVLIFCIVIIAALLTYIVPAGEYARVEDPNTGRTVVDPNSFTKVERNPVNPFEVLTAVPRGMIAAAQITFFIFIVAGSFQIITSTGAIEAGIYRVANMLRGKELLLIPIFMFLFSLTGAFLGFAEENIVFIPVAISLARALGYDAIVGMSLVTLGGAVGFNSAMMNPFTVGIAQGIAELPLFSGIGLRFIIWLVLLAVSIYYVMRYAMKIKDKPELSIIAEVELEERKNSTFDIGEDKKLLPSHYLVFLVLAAGLATIVYGVYKFGWYINEIAAVFLGMGIISGFIGKIGPNKMAQEFINGARGIVFGALVVGIARTILIVLQDGLILDSIIYYLASLISGLPKALAAVGMFIIQSLINFVIPSGSGQAATTMPIMVPLADILGISRQTAVLAFHFGDGFSNTFTPTASTLMASLSIAKIAYDKWLKYYAKLFFIWSLIGAIFMIIATVINYGPF
ncbi:MAG: putative basic amino acid antiporter YfcC [Tissierellia bacterium]|nr:putative basic amino acid antiporter YfcC [Tissierellia bacterium]